MVLLASVGNIHDFLRAEVLDSVEEGRQVGGGVVRRPVAFADNERLGFEAFVFAQEDDERALIFLGDAALGQFLVDAPDFVAVE